MLRPIKSVAGKRATPEQRGSASSLDAKCYSEWIKKFDVKKTTDSCFTPPNVFEAVRQWVVSEYGLQGRQIERPFFPGGDYRRHEYPGGCVVIDNPPFSILSQIVRWYELMGIDYFLFAPHLTLFGINAKCSIIANCSIIYDNGARINTDFVTNMDKAAIRTAPALKKAVDEADEKNKVARTLPKYVYPDNVISAALLGKIADVDFMVMPHECSDKVGALKNQKEVGKAIFGGGRFISDAKAAELKAAELKAKKEAIVWELHWSEKMVIKQLNEAKPND